MLEGHVQIDDAYLGGERTGGKVGRGSNNKIPFVAAVSINDEGNPVRVKLTPVATFSSESIAQWAMSSLAPGSIVHSDGLAYFRAVATAGRTHEPVIDGGRKPKELPVFQRINTVLGNLTTSLWGSYHGFGFQKYASRYLGVFAYRFNRRFDLRTLHQRLLVAAVSCAPLPRRAIRMAEAHC